MRYASVNVSSTGIASVTSVDIIIHVNVNTTSETFIHDCWYLAIVARA